MTGKVNVELTALGKLKSEHHISAKIKSFLPSIVLVLQLLC